jgi:general secretion pathway protein J
LLDRLPDRVSIAVQTQTGDWPEMVIALRVLPGTDPRARRAVFGGSVG